MAETSWREVPGFDGYEVSDAGNVRSRRINGRGTALAETPHPLKPAKASNGYLMVGLSRGSEVKYRTVHSLVAEAFIGPRPEGMQVAHNNGDRCDNRLSNLRYDTPLGNAADRVAHGTDIRGEDCWMAKLTEEDVRDIQRLWNHHTMIQKEIGALYGITQSAVSRIVNGKVWSHVEPAAAH